MRNTRGWGDYIQQLRRATGLSRPELARRLGVNPATVWRWETQGAKPESTDVPEALAEKFHLELDEVLAAAGLRPGVEAPAQPTVEPDPELDLVRSDPNLSPEMRERIIRMVLERRERERQAGIEETQRIINLFRRAG